MHGPDSVDYRVVVHHEGGSFWAEVEELPGCFASGETEDELWTALQEAVSVYLSTPEAHVEVEVSGRIVLDESQRVEATLAVV